MRGAKCERPKGAILPSRRSDPGVYFQPRRADRVHFVRNGGRARWTSAMAADSSNERRDRNWIRLASTVTVHKTYGRECANSIPRRRGRQEMRGFDGIPNNLHRAIISIAAARGKRKCGSQFRMPQLMRLHDKRQGMREAIGNRRATFSVSLGPSMGAGINAGTQAHPDQRAGDLLRYTGQLVARKLTSGERPWGYAVQIEGQGRRGARALVSMAISKPRACRARSAARRAAGACRQCRRHRA